MAKSQAKARPAKRILEDIPRPSSHSILEAFYGGAPDTRRSPREIPIEQIDPNPHQPRRRFDGEQLAVLVDSIRELGLIHPILVRPVGERYQIVCGERRYRACRELGMTQIRAESRELDATTAYKIALSENVQRDSLDATEEAHAYQRLLGEGMSQAELARSLGIDRRRISEKLQLLVLPAEVLELLSARADKWSERHARLLAQAPAGLDLLALAQRTIEREWSTRQLEEEIQRAARPAPAESPHLFENVRYSLNKRGGFTLTVRARSRQEVARTIAELEEKLGELREAFHAETSARADKGGTSTHRS